MQHKGWEVKGSCCRHQPPFAGDQKRCPRATQQTVLRASHVAQVQRKAEDCQLPTALISSYVHCECHQPHIRMSALLWHPNLKQSCERNTPLASGNDVLVRLFSWSWRPATEQTTHRDKFQSSLGQLVDYPYQREFQKVL